MIHDVAILGAGPAGSLAARRLVLAGARVALLGGDSRPGVEGLSSRSHALLAAEGLDDRSGVFVGPYARDGQWTDDRRVEGFEWLTERSALSRALRDAAVLAGVDSCASNVRELRREGGQWQIRLADGSICAAPIVIDARGRRGPELRGPVLLAVGRRYCSDLVHAPGTHLQATDYGWCWWVVRGSDIWVQVVGRPRARHVNDWIEATAGCVAGLAQTLEGATAVGRCVARPAHARLGLHRPDASLWHVGDAAMALDPLSGQGIYEALRGARLVAAAVQSVMEGGEPGLARRFVTERTHEAWERGVRLAAGFYRELAARSDFWLTTAQQYEALIPRTAVSAATEEYRPVLVDGRIVAREVLVTAEHPRGVWHVEGVPLVALKRYLEGAPNLSVPAVARALEHPLTSVASAIHWLQTSGFLHGQNSSSVASGG